MSAEAPPSQYGSARQRIAAEIVGREREIELTLAAVNTGRDLLLEGPPGSSKTTLLKAITEAWGVPLMMVEGNAELTPARLLGHHDPARVLRDGYTQETFQPGPLVEAMQTGGFLYFEEFNRAPEDTLNTLLTAIADRRVTIPRFGTVEALPTFRVVGSMNPYDSVGTTRLSVSIKDRLNRLVVDYQDADSEAEIVRRRRPGIEAEPFGQRVVVDAVAVTRATREHRAVVQGSSVRGAIDLAALAVELCSVRGLTDAKDPAYDEALWDAMLLALSGRLTLDHAADVDEETVLREIWEKHRRGSTIVDPALESSIVHESPDLEGGTEKDLADRANRAFRIQPKELSTDPELNSGSGGAGLAMVPEQPEDNGSKRLPSSSATTSEEGQLDDEEGERAGPGPETRRRALEIAKRLQLRDPVPRPTRRRGGLEMASLPYREGEDEIDLDRTIEGAPGGRVLRSEEIFIRERRRTGREIVVAVDVSGSMGGERLLTAAATVGALMTRMHRDDLGVVAFWSDAAILLRLGERAPLEQLIDAMLGLEARGLTNVSFPLEVAADQLGGPGVREQRVLLLSDCVHNAGPDPRAVATRLPRIDVLFDVAGERDSELAAQIAGAGRGLVLPVKGFGDVPGALSRVFSGSE